MSIVLPSIFPMRRQSTGDVVKGGGGGSGSGGNSPSLDSSPSNYKFRSTANLTNGFFKVSQKSSEMSNSDSQLVERRASRRNKSMFSTIGNASKSRSRETSIKAIAGETTGKDTPKSKPNLHLQTFNKPPSVVYDESPAKMQQLKSQRATLKEQLLASKVQRDHSKPRSYSSSNNISQQSTSHTFSLTSAEGSSTRHFASAIPDHLLFLASIMEGDDERMSCEKSPNLAEILSAISPSPMKHEPYKKNAFSFMDTRLLGDDALRDRPKLKFNANYKQLDKILDVDSHYQQDSSIGVSMLRATIGKTILPRKLGIVKEDNHKFVFPKPQSKQKLDLSNQNIAARYHEMISQALSHGEMSELSTINLSSNNLTGDSVKVIAKNLTKNIEKVYLDSNFFGSDSASGIIPLLDTNVFSRLRVLSLEGNNLSDLGILELLPALLKNRSIQRLNLSHNKLTDISGDYLGQYILESSYLQELYLHWNKISSAGGLAIATGLQSNTSLEVLDLSHNGMGVLKKMRSGLAMIKSCTVQGTSMKHLDLSFNRFQIEECQEIGAFLAANNQTLVGIHFEGNDGGAIFDPRGFLHFPQKVISDSVESDAIQHVGMVSKHRINGFKCLGVNKQVKGLTASLLGLKMSNLAACLHSLRIQSFDCLSTDNCWICDGWQEVEFTVTTGCSDSFLGKPVFLHLDFEGYRPHYMNADQKDPTKFTIHRMCPPNRQVHFFFSDPTQPIIYYSKHQPYTIFNNHHEDCGLHFYSEDDREGNRVKGQLQQKQDQQPSADSPSKVLASQSPLSLSMVKSTALNLNRMLQRHQLFARGRTLKLAKRYFKLTYLDTTVIEYTRPSVVNVIQTGRDKKVLARRELEPLISAKIREAETYCMITKTDKWTFEVSLFRTYVRDSQDLLDRCFEVDWKNGRLEKVIASCGDMPSTKEAMKKSYPVYRNLYKYLSSVGMVGDIPCITMNQYSSLLTRTQIIDGKKLRTCDGDINFITSNSGGGNSKEKNYKNPEKALVRYEFMEVLGRLAIEKYVKNGEPPMTPKDAFETLINDKLIANKLMETESQQGWRDERYWNEECDNEFKKQLSFVKGLWDTWADSRKTEKRYFMNTKTMSVFEFTDMIKWYDLLDERVTERDLLLSYNLSMMTQEDENDSDRFIQMSFVELLEAIARLAEKKSKVPLGESEQDYTEEERRDLPLCYKLESMLDEMQEKYETFVSEGKRGGGSTPASLAGGSTLSERKTPSNNNTSRKTIVKLSTSTPTNQKMRSSIVASESGKKQQEKGSTQSSFFSMAMEAKNSERQSRNSLIRDIVVDEGDEAAQQGESSSSSSDDGGL